MSRARLHVTFPQDLMNEPVVHRLGADFDLVVNIRRANLEEDGGGWVILEVDGEQERIEAAVTWLAGQGLLVDRIEG